MKKRSSQSKAEWSEKREISYKEMAFEIAYTQGFQLIERNSIVYRIENESEFIFLKSEKPKSIWYETWKKLTLPDDEPVKINMPFEDAVKKALNTPIKAKKK